MSVYSICIYIYIYTYVYIYIYVYVYLFHTWELSHGVHRGLAILPVVAQVVAAVVARVCSSFVVSEEHASHDSA